MTTLPKRCVRCRGWHRTARKCKAGLPGPPDDCALFREVWSYADTNAWLNRRDLLEARGKRAGVDCWHTAILSDHYDGVAMETMTIWSEREEKAIRVDEDSGADRGLQLAEQLIDSMILSGDVIKRAPRVPRGTLKPPEER